MLPSSAEMAERIRKHAEGMAQEIARRVVQDVGHSAHGRDLGTNVEHHAKMVLLDWYLGDFIPGGVSADSGMIVGGVPEPRK